MCSIYTVKKDLAIFPSPSWDALTKVSLGVRESLVCDIPAGGRENRLVFFYGVRSLPVAGDVSIGVAGSKPLDSQAPVRDPTHGQVLGTGGNCGNRKNVKVMA
jgi:hypothetical protein